MRADGLVAVLEERLKSRRVPAASLTTTEAARLACHVRPGDRVEVPRAGAPTTIAPYRPRAGLVSTSP